MATTSTAVTGDSGRTWETNMAYEAPADDEDAVQNRRSVVAIDPTDSDSWSDRITPKTSTSSRCTADGETAVTAASSGGGGPTLPWAPPASSWGCLAMVLATLVVRRRATPSAA